MTTGCGCRNPISSPGTGLLSTSRWEPSSGAGSWARAGAKPPFRGRLAGERLRAGASLSQLGREDGIGLRELRADPAADKGELLPRRRRGDGRRGRMVEVEAGRGPHLRQVMARVDRFQAEAAGEAETGKARHQRLGAAAAVDILRAQPGRADEAAPPHQAAPAVLLAEEHDPRHQEVEIGRAEGAREAPAGAPGRTDLQKVDIGLAVDL